MGGAHTPLTLRTAAGLLTLLGAAGLIAELARQIESDWVAASALLWTLPAPTTWLALGWGTWTG